MGGLAIPGVHIPAAIQTPAATTPTKLNDTILPSNDIAETRPAALMAPPTGPVLVGDTGALGAAEGPT